MAKNNFYVDTMNSNNKLPIQVCTWALIDGGWLPLGHLTVHTVVPSCEGPTPTCNNREIPKCTSVQHQRTFNVRASTTGIPALTANWAEFFKNCVKGVSPIAYVAIKNLSITLIYECKT